MADFMTPPPHARMAPSGPAWLDEDGIIITISTLHTHTLEDAIENLRISREIGLGIPRPILVDMTNVRSIPKEAREEYVKSQSTEVVNAVALMTESNVGRMVGNLFIGFHKHLVPVKMFTDYHKAKEWLLQYRVS